MLGRLVTWLRLLGCDTAYAGKLDDAQIARHAQQEGRIVLTRDRELARRKSIRTILIDSVRVDEQIMQVLQRKFVLADCIVGPDQCIVAIGNCLFVIVRLIKGGTKQLQPATGLAGHDFVQSLRNHRGYFRP